jgi:AraC family transcriptional regulator
MHTARVPLDEPPSVVNAGISVHGLTGLEDRFRLPDLWQLHLYSYEGELEVGGTVHPIRPGHVSVIPADAEVFYRYRGPSEHLYIHARLSDRGESYQVPVMQHAGAAVGAFDRMLRSAITAAAATPSRANAEIWTALWRLTQLRPPQGGGNTAVASAVAYVEQHLPRPITVPEVAEAAGVSHNHLTRLFRAERGTTVVAYIRGRRLQRAAHLLRESTLSIPVVAASVGIPDLQAFNKACRQEFGRSPRALRARQG